MARKAKQIEHIQSTSFALGIYQLKKFTSIYLLINSICIRFTSSKNNTMAITRLKRKGRRNILKAKNKRKAIKRLKAVPVIRNIDVEAIKKEFSKKSSKVEEKEATAEVKPQKKPKAVTKKKN